TNNDGQHPKMLVVGCYNALSYPFGTVDQKRNLIVRFQQTSGAFVRAKSPFGSSQRGRADLESVMLHVGEQQKIQASRSAPRCPMRGGARRVVVLQILKENVGEFRGHYRKYYTQPA